MGTRNNHWFFAKYLQNAQVFSIRQISPPGTERVSFRKRSANPLNPNNWNDPFSGNRKCYKFDPPCPYISPNNSVENAEILSSILKGWPIFSKTIWGRFLTSRNWSLCICPNAFPAHTIHVWHICLHLVDLYAIHGWYGQYIIWNMVFEVFSTTERRISQFFYQPEKNPLIGHQLKHFYQVKW